MKMKAFDHVNVKTAKLDEMILWYEDVLGLKSGPRPSFPFPGAWMYLGKQPILHLVGVDEEPQSVDPKIEHFALSAEGMTEFEAHLQERNISARIFEVPGFDIIQFNIFDPDNNHIHIDFAKTESI
jgi:catechol 2,3-dioxygenase-like lactoylglutathione lyase family enzyme